MKRLMLTGALLVLAPLFGAFSATAEQAGKVMKIGLATAETHIQNTGSMAFKAYVEDKTNGEIKVEIYPGAQLGDNKTMLDSVKIGVVDGIFPSPADLGNVSPDFNMLNFPFIFDSQKVANAVMDGPFGEQLLASLDRYGYKGLVIVDSGFRHTTNSKHSIASLDDFKGLKIRMQPNPLHLDIFRALGANPTPMAFSELFSALQQGVMDGQENPLNNIYASKFNEVQKYLTLDGHIYDSNIFLVGKDFFEGLDPERQQIIVEGAKIARQVMRDALQEKDAAALKGIKASGMEVTEVTPEFHKQLVEATRPVIEKYKSQVDPQLYQSLQDAIAAATAM